MSHRLLLRLLPALVVLGSALAPGLLAAAPADAEMQARYQRERAACTRGESPQSQRDCLREAEAAHAEMRRGKLEAGPGPEARNALMRCDVHRGDERQACLARMQGQGSTSGSAEAGGILRESTLRRVGDGPPTVVTPKP